MAPALPSDVQEPVLDIIEEWPTDAGPPARREPSAPLSMPRSERPDRAHVTIAEATLVIREHIVEEESQRLDKWVDFVQRSGVPVDGKMLYGTPFLEIIREVLRNEHDLVRTTAEGRGGLQDRLFGSTTMHLMRKSPCPVWVVGPTQPERCTRILAAVDPVPLDEEQYA